MAASVQPIESVRAVKLLVLLLPLLCQGCLTSALWQEHDDAPSHQRVVVQDVTESLSGTLQVEDQDLRLRTEDGKPGWLVRPVPGQALLHTLLTDEEMTQSLELQMHATSSFVDDRLEDAHASLELRARLRPGAIARRCPLAECTPDLRAAMSRTGQPGEAELHRRCVGTLVPNQLQWLLPAASKPHLSSYVYVDRTGQPAFATNIAGPATSPRTDLREQLLGLRQLALLILVETDNGERFARIVPERLWLAHRANALAGRTVVTANATFLVAPNEERRVPADGQPPRQHPVQLSNRIIRIENQPTGYRRSFWTKLMLTPFTLLIDIPLLCLQACLGDDEDDDE